MVQLSFQRLDDLLNYLIGQTRPVTLENLSKITKVSSRTLRSDIKLINEHIMSNGGEIVLIRKKGYLMEYSDQKKFDNFWQDHHTGTFLFTTAESRIHYLIRLFLTSDRFVTQEYLLNTLFVSQNTLYSDFKVLKKILEPYQLKIVNKSNLGYRINGQESDMRLAINHLIFQSNLTEFITSANQIDKDICMNIDYASYGKLFNQFLTQLVQLDSDYFQRNAFVSILLALSRIKEGNTVTTFSAEISLNTERQNIVSGFIAEVERTFSIKISDLEENYIAYILTENFPQIINDPSDFENRALAQEMVEMILSQLYQTTHAEWTRDNHLKHHLTDHMQRLLNIHKINGSRNNPILEDVKNNFPYPFELAVLQIQRIETQFNMSFTEDEISYIALYFASAIESHQNHHKMSLAIVCGTGKILSAIIESRIKRKFPDTFSEIKKLSYHEFKASAPQETYDLVVSTVPFQHATTKNIIFFDINHLEEAFLNIEDQINHYHVNDVTTQLFNASHFTLISDKLSKAEVLKDMHDILFEQGLVTEDFINCVLERENISSTVIDNVIALPHPTRDCVKMSSVFVAVAPKGIEWGDSKKVTFIFLLAIKTEDVEEIADIYDLILDFIASDEKQGALLKTPTYDKLIDLFSNREIVV